MPWPCWPAGRARSRPPAPPARTLHFDGQRVEAPALLAGLPAQRSTRGCACGSTAAPSTWGRPGRTSAARPRSIGRRRAILVEPRARRRAPRARPCRSPARRIATASAGGSVFTGLGFDACAAPSSRSMAAWAASPYRAIGVYIGGANRGCSQPNLTASWVSAQTAAGWHLIPTYVGLQAPTSSCGSCAKLSASQATAQGEEAAVDAVAQAAAVAMGPGSPIYFDMESYSRTSSATAATLTFLEAWTEKLHALGYVSGVYSSSASGIADLADQVGTGYVLPDNLWIANWNGAGHRHRPLRPRQRLEPSTSASTSTAAATTRPTAASRSTSTTTTSTAAPSAPAASPTTNEDPVGCARPGRLAHPGPGAGQRLGLRPQRCRPNRWRSAPTSAAAPGAAERASNYDLGAIANQARADVGAKYRRAGAQPRLRRHLPDRQVGTAAGLRLRAQHRRRRRPPARLQDRPRSRSRSRSRTLKTTPTARQGLGHLRLAAGDRLPGPARAPHPGQDRPPPPPRHAAADPRRHPLARPPRLPAHRQAGHGFVIPLSAGGRALLKQRGSLRSQLIAAIPGGRRIVAVGLGR